MTIERRRAPRAQVDFLLNVFHDGQPSLCVASNLSESGIRVQRVQQGRALQGSIVEVEFQLPGIVEVVMARGRVHHDDNQSVGLSFEALPTVTKHLIGTYVRAAA